MDFLDWLRALFALVATLSLIGLAAYGARRFGMLDHAGGGVKRERRMRVAESLMLDPRRRLIIVRVDEREHVLLLSPAGDKVVATMDARPESPAESQP